MKTAYKLTGPDNKTHKDFLWVPGEWKETTGKGNLCGSGWIHAYQDPLVAVFMNVVHAKIQKPKLWKAEVSGMFKDDRGLKCGYTKMKLIKEVPISKISLEKSVDIAIYIAVLAGYQGESFLNWTSQWLDDKDRSEKAARIVLATIGSEGPPAYATREIANATWAAKCAVRAAIKFKECSYNKDYRGLVRESAARTVIRAADSGAEFDLAQFLHTF